MRTRYKTGKFTRALTTCKGDELHLTLREKDGTTQTVREDIKVSMTITHWVMFYVPGVGFGGLFGGPDIGAKMSEIFVEPVLISDDEILIT